MLNDLRMSYENPAPRVPTPEQRSFSSPGTKGTADIHTACGVLGYGEEVN